MIAKADKTCPQCHSAEVAKASALYYDCTVAEKDKEWPPTERPDWERYKLAPVEAKARKELANKLAPPPNPTAKSASPTGGGIEAVGMFADGGVVGLIVGSVLALIAIPLALLGDSSGPRPDWQIAMDRWDSLYYCAHCDGVFTPSQGGLVPSKQMRSLLYR